jgi:hypothetical protein
MIIESHHIQHRTVIKRTFMGIPIPYKQTLIDEIYKIGDQQDCSTNVKAIMTSYTLHLETDIFKPFLENLDSAFRIMYGIKSDIEIEHFNFWGVIYKKGHYTIPHNHFPGQLSWVYYLKTHEDSSPLVFDDSDIKIPVQEDLLITFPMYVRHSVPIQTHVEDRICIAGNCFINTKYDIFSTSYF